MFTKMSDKAINSHSLKSIGPAEVPNWQYMSCLDVVHYRVRTIFDLDLCCEQKAILYTLAVALGNPDDYDSGCISCRPVDLANLSGMDITRFKEHMTDLVVKKRLVDVDFDGKENMLYALYGALGEVNDC